MHAMIFRRSLLVSLGLLLCGNLAAQELQADAENCNLCHSLALMGIAMDDELRSFEVTENAYNHSTHRNVRPDS